MKEKIRKILSIQKCAFIAVWVAPILLAVLYETGVFQK